MDIQKQARLLCKKTQEIMEVFDKVPSSEILRWAGWKTTDMNFTIGVPAFSVDMSGLPEMHLPVVDDWGETYELTITLSDRTCEELQLYQSR